MQNLESKGIRAVLLFGIPGKKDAMASEAFNPSGVVQQAVRSIKDKVPEVMVITDVCACEYTDHGHCGIVGDTPGGIDVLNDPSLDLMAQIAVSHAAMIDLGTETCRVKKRDGIVSRYEEIINKLKEESQKRDVKLLYNDIDPTYNKKNAYAPAYLIGAMRYISPEIVWKDGYDWRKVDYNTYSKHSGFRRKLLRYATGKEPIPNEKTAFASSQVL